MGRFASAASLASIFLLCLLIAGCGSSKPTQVVSNEVPASISITPSPNASLELGQTLTLSPTAKNSAGTNLTENFSYQSTNSSVVTVSTTGQACAGTWDSLSNPLVCTPGATGTAQVTAVANGVSSPPVTVYVHQHITNIVITKVPSQPPTLSTTCFSAGAPAGPEHVLYQASAMSGSIDITPSVGPFTWQSVAPGSQTNVVTLTAPATGAPLNQETVTATTSGVTFISASTSGVNSQSLPFTTCPVASVSITAVGNPPTSVAVNSGTTTTLNATATDTLGMNLTAVPLTWSSTNPAAVSATGQTSTVYASVGSVNASVAGAASVIASCTPPTCNGGIAPSLPIYPNQAVRFLVQTPSTPANPTVYATSTACNSTTQACMARIVPITRSSSTAGFAPGTAVNLPFAPNSILSDLQGSNVYLGVNSSSFGTNGVMVFTGTTVSHFTGAAGKVLAISPDGNVVILSDTVDSPNRVFICQGCSGTSASSQTFLFNAATAAAFSPDSVTNGFKAYTVSGTSCPGTASLGCLLVYSQVDAPKLVPLSAPATDVAFIGNGTLGYLAGADPLGAAFLPTCDDPSAAGSITGLGLPSQFIRALPDGQSALALFPPDIQSVTATITGTGCPPPRGSLTIKNVVNPVNNLGTGNFTPTQFLISPDGSAAYVLGEVVPQLRTVISITAAIQNGASTSYSYSLTSGPPLRVGMMIAVSGLQRLADNGLFLITGLGSGTFTVANPGGTNTAGESGTGTVTPQLPYIMRFDLVTHATSLISLAGNANPLSATLSPAGDLLFVGGDDGTVHVIDTNSRLDLEQVALTFPDSSVCVGPGSPATRAPIVCNPDLIVAKP